MSDEPAETIAVDTTIDVGGTTWQQIWHVPPPVEGSTYRVLRQTWNHDDTERHIYEIEIVA